jgi:hypothetical protein
MLFELNYTQEGDLCASSMSFVCNTWGLIGRAISICPAPNSRVKLSLSTLTLSNVTLGANSASVLASLGKMEASSG